MLSQQELLEKWEPLLKHEALPEIKDVARRNITAVLLENTQIELAKSSSFGGRTLLAEGGVPVNAMGSSSSTAGAGAIDTFDPVLISLVRRAAPQMIAYDICGVQPMTGPTGLIFAMRSRYSNQTGTEAFYNEANTGYATVASGNNSAFGGGQVGTLPGNTTVTSNLSNNVYNYAQGMSRAQAEALGTSGNVAFPEMSFSIEKSAVEAKTRALKAEYTMEMAQDLKAVHGMDVESELSNILSTEILSEINREVVRTVYITAKSGSQSGTTTAGVFDFDTDSNGRWLVEKYKGLYMHLERESNKIAKDTRRGKGNLLICTSDVASALNMAGVLDYTPALNTNLMVDDTGPTFAGVIGGRTKVFIDPYAIGGDFAIVGFKGQNNLDSGLFYCPYVPLQMVRAVEQDTFNARIGFKTRYGMIANPYAGGATKGLGALTADSNVYYRRSIIANIM